VYWTSVAKAAIKVKDKSGLSREDGGGDREQAMMLKQRYRGVYEKARRNQGAVGISKGGGRETAGLR